jgi:2-dehydro-3-deoxyphosphogluconate aldolase / (4S)-4-hydroxy-2-oxoglutarate aldolase
MVSLPIPEQLRQARIVPVVRCDDFGLARTVCDLLVEAGIRALEITTSISGCENLISELRRNHPDLLIGAGTVMSADQARAVQSAGSQFVVSPCWVEEVASETARLDTAYLPGAMTPGEIVHHWSHGAAVVKIFPAVAAGGPDFIRALQSVFPDIPLMPTGGISPGSVQDYFDSGAVCVGMGGNLIPFNALKAGDVASAQTQIRAALDAARLNQL